MRMQAEAFLFLGTTANRNNTTLRRVKEEATAEGAIYQIFSPTRSPS